MVAELRLSLGALYDAVKAGEADLSPYEPSPVGLPTVASPDAAPSDRVAFSQIVQAIACRHDWFIAAEEWPDIARAIIDGGGDWPALAALTVIAPDDQDGANAAALRLQQQTEDELGAHPRLPFLEVLTGVIARGERLQGTHSAISTYNIMWWELDDWDSRGPGDLVIRTAEVLSDLAGFALEDQQTNRRQQELLIAEAERLIPPYSVNTALSRALTTLFHTPLSYRPT